MVSEKPLKTELKTDLCVYYRIYKGFSPCTSEERKDLSTFIIIGSTSPSHPHPQTEKLQSFQGEFC